MLLEIKQFKLNKPDLKEGGKVVNKISHSSINNVNNENKTNKNRRKPRKSLSKEILSNLNSTKIKFATSSDIIIEGEKKECLIDSGALTSFINYSYAVERKFNIEKVKNRKNWVSANGSQIEIAGQCELIIKIKRVQIKAIFIIAKNLSHDVIIGTDILKQNKCVVSCQFECGGCRRWVRRLFACEECSQQRQFQPQQQRQFQLQPQQQRQFQPQPQQQRQFQPQPQQQRQFQPQQQGQFQPQQQLGQFRSQQQGQCQPPTYIQGRRYHHRRYRYQDENQQETGFSKWKEETRVKRQAEVDQARRQTAILHERHLQEDFESLNEESFPSIE